MDSSVDLDKSQTADLLELIVGRTINVGTYRHVYEYRPDTTKVIKVEKGGYKFDNIQEWEVWNQAQETYLGKWLARCFTVSMNGLVLIQERTFPIHESKLPSIIPDVLCDCKRENWGLVKRGGKLVPVCHDYAHNTLVGRGLGKKERLVKADWFDPSYKGWDVDG